MRTIEWCEDHAVLLDQTLLPHEVVRLEVRDVDTMIDAIVRLAVRGAPALGVAGGFGVAIAALDAERHGRPASFVHAEAARIAAARPTAVNLSWAVRRVAGHIDDGAAAVVAEAVAVAEEDIRANRALAHRGADLLEQLADSPMRVHTHCNTGALACVEWGTGLGIVRVLHERGALRSVTADETRPLLQGSRLTAFELAELGIEHQIVVDSAGPTVIARGLADVVVVGADRIAANGDVANKIGTYGVAVLAREHGIPFYVAAPLSTIDLNTPDGSRIPIEERNDREVTHVGSARLTPEGAKIRNPAFDVTPAKYVTAIITERGIARAPYDETLAQLMGQQPARA
jgi:methylthioribose-1-phosphate isomerase